ncbi:hypothetical protein GCM10027404_21850 [Arthrobacter tumbae]|uniref:hypothetical protein n=1 Tax=Arthrobacter tumbae TaxID=163874 RepID=UPI00195B6642|nr:hypothetical protein [Arthrobacter tumbae]MBM7781870.1 hypothetical protein [Arthrobacter tumbae]
MATKRKSALQIAAHEKALRKAAEFHKRHEKLLNLAGEFFVAQDEGERIRDEAQQRAQELIDRAEKDAAAAERKAAGKARAMIATGEPQSAVAQRLGLSPAALRKLLNDVDQAEPGNTGDERSSAGSKDDGASGNDSHAQGDLADQEADREEAA